MDAELTTYERSFHGERDTCIKLTVRGDAFEAVKMWLKDAGFHINSYGATSPYHIYVFLPEEDT